MMESTHSRKSIRSAVVTEADENWWISVGCLDVSNCLDYFSSKSKWPCHFGFVFKFLIAQEREFTYLYLTEESSLNFRKYVILDIKIKLSNRINCIHSILKYSTNRNFSNLLNIIPRLKSINNPWKCNRILLIISNPTIMFSYINQLIIKTNFKRLSVTNMSRDM